MVENNSGIAVKGGWLIKNISDASGGVRYQRKYLNEELDGERLTADFETHKTVDHVTYVKDLDGVKRHIEYLCRKHCTRTSFGWFTDDAGLAGLRADVERLEAQARALNESAAIAGSNHRLRVGIIPTRVEVDTPEAAREISRTIREVLTQTRDALKAGELGRWNALALKLKGLDRLAIDMQADMMLKNAMACVVEARKQLKAAITAGHLATVAGNALDLTLVDDTIACFTPMSENFGAPAVDPTEEN